MLRGDVAFMIGVVAVALALAEMSVRQEASTRWFCVALVWVVVVAMLAWTAYG
jgi:hypothetical protein